MSIFFIAWLLAATVSNSGGMAYLNVQASNTERNCKLGGTFRVNVGESDKLYSVVKEATSTVPFGDQQRFFMDLSTRLTPPDVIAITCKGQQVSVGSSRGSRVTYVADGRTRRERGASGNFVNARIEMKSDMLTFISTGEADDNVNVSFQALVGGTRLAVTRRIYASQLPEPIIIRTIYDRIAESVDWNDFDNLAAARRNQTASSMQRNRGPIEAAPEERAGALRDALRRWVDATNRRDIADQMEFYAPVLSAYYLTRNTPRKAVLAEKRRVFGKASRVNIKAEEPEIIFQDNGKTAIMRFIKEYRVIAQSRTKSGVVVQELRWRQSGNDWQIISERDIRVIR